MSTILFIRASQPATSLRRRDATGREKKKGKNDGEKSEEDASYILSYNAIRFVFYIRPQAISSFPAPLQLPPISPMRRVHIRSIHPRGTTATWIILIFAPAKVSQRDYCSATRFHPRETRRGEDRVREWRGQVVTRLRRLNITVNRVRSNSDAAGVMRKHLSRWRDWGWRNPAHSRREKERKKDKVGWINPGISLSPQDRKD